MKRIEETFRQASTQFLPQGPNDEPLSPIPETLRAGAPTHALLSVQIPVASLSIEATTLLLRALSESGIDFIQLELPVDSLRISETSDRLGSARATDYQSTLEEFTDQIAEVRADVAQPILLVVSYQQCIAYGSKLLLDRCEMAGVDGLILPDMPIEEYRSHWRSEVEQRELGVAFPVTSNTPDNLIFELDALCRGFLYVDMTGSITDDSKALSGKSHNFLERLNQLDLISPRLILGHISNRRDLGSTTRYAAGGIVDTAFTQALDAEDLAGSAKRFVQSLR